MFSDNDIEAMRSAVAYGTDGAKIGSVGDVYLDDATGQPTWVTVNSGLFGTNTHFVPLHGATLAGDKLTLGFTKDKVMDAPRLAEDEHLSGDDEARLHEFYGTTPAIDITPATMTGDRAEQVGDVIRTDRPAGDFVDETDLDTLHDDAGHIAPAAAGTPRADEAEARVAAHADVTGEELDRARQASEDARFAAEQADPIGDGSYAGDASKSSLIDTPDLEAHDHAAETGSGHAVRPRVGGEL